MTPFRLRFPERCRAALLSTSLTVVLVVCILAGVLPVCVRIAQAGSGGVITLPMSGVKVRSKLRLQIDTRWVDGSGYRPVRVRISPIPMGPAPADRSIQLTIKPRNRRMGTARHKVTQTVELAQGAMFGEATIAIPHYASWGSFEIETFEDGDRLRDLCIRGIGMPVRTYYNWSESTPSIVILDPDAPSTVITSNLRTMPQTVSVTRQAAYGMASMGMGYESAASTVSVAGIRAVASPLPLNDFSGLFIEEFPLLLPDVRALASRIPLNHYSGIATQHLFDTSKDIDDAAILRLLTDLPRVDIFPPEDLPDRWLELSCIDVMVVSFDELARIVRELPSTWQAMRDWQACGATLCVYGVGEEYQLLAALETHLDAIPLPVDKARPYARGWHEPRSKGYTDEIHSLMAVSNNVSYYNMSRTMTAQGLPAPTRKRAPPGIQPFIFRDVRQGEVVAIGAANPFPGDPADWSWIFNNIASDHWMWYRRHGVSMHRENPEYWDLLIPGVGEAPVNSFLVLITLFVVIIGPVNYFVLYRQRRLYLILVTVPLGALIVTGSLLVYAVLTDGLGVRLRTRSLTEIDQPSGQVVAWSRQSYYAGLTPADGLSFPKDAAVYPVEHRPLGRNGFREGRNHLVWDGGQRLASGFLTTRSTKQFLVVESRKSARGLTIEESVDPPRATNGLGTAIDHLIVRGVDGRLFAATRVEPGETAGLQPISGAAATKRWNKLLAANRPGYPEGFDPYQLENAADFFDSYNYAQDIDQGLAKPSFKSSLFERRLRELMAIRFKGLQPRSYLASVAEPVEVSVGVEDARSEAGFYLVTGRW